MRGSSHLLRYIALLTRRRLTVVGAMLREGGDDPIIRS